jgi:hypothetical protein
VKSENFTLVAIAAEMFSCRPSALVALRDPLLALDFDLAAAAHLLALRRPADPASGDRPGEAPANIRHLHW